MKKWILIVVGVLVVGFVGYQWYSSKTSTQTASALVRTANVQKGTLEVKISGSGTVQSVTNEDIKSLIDNNEIDEVLVASGEEVKKGAVLMTYIDGSDPIIAPADGVITAISVLNGERVNNGQVVAHLTNYKDLQTVVQIDELDIPKIEKDQTVALKVNAFPDQIFTGTVTTVAEEGAATNGVSNFDVTIHIDKPDHLKVGMSTEASILTASKENTLYVPLDAVHTVNGEKYVIAASAGTDNANSGKAQITVKTGLANEDFVEITDGLSEGDTVQLPQLATGNSSGNQMRTMQGSFGGGMGGFGNMGGMNRSGGGRAQFGGRSGN
ncbi:biotin/lipoyl attachment domain-containing protein [Neobacillus bataviensis LMG 21833]|uniref:Biotin/lipoyl attachment domain-containing protein n=1 Tax=Neobacillus bataviensis LMG 21833 TaxID=1117379 RepID=K6DDW1_9BACI|nr:efflux RND transporter periplasmic adaptor subunit [Neobacillus bataviensis]EKN70722.1 biotin/lipoyl attachment domain-containing protein [Neobacillus bataviensis LMG 21833]